LALLQNVSGRCVAPGLHLERECKNLRGDGVSGSGYPRRRPEAKPLGGAFRGKETRSYQVQTGGEDGGGGGAGQIPVAKEPATSDPVTGGGRRIDPGRPPKT